MNVVSILVGVALLLAGRKLFWLFVGAVGFAYGLRVAPHIFAGVSGPILLLLAIGMGIIGAVLALLFQKLAIGLAGALLGGYFGAHLAFTLGLNTHEFALIPFVIGAVAGAVLVVILFDWALIILSSMAGAILIAQPLTLATGA